MDKHQSSAPAQPTTDEKYDAVVEAHFACLERLEERYRHELMDDEERQDRRRASTYRGVLWGGLRRHKEAPHLERHGA